MPGIILVTGNTAMHKTVLTSIVEKKTIKNGKGNSHKAKKLIDTDNRIVVTGGKEV